MPTKTKTKASAKPAHKKAAAHPAKKAHSAKPAPSRAKAPEKKQAKPTAADRAAAKASLTAQKKLLKME